MIRFVFIVGNALHSSHEQLILDLIPRALHSVACSQLDNADGVADVDCGECIRAIAEAPVDSWEKTYYGLKCSVESAVFELLFDVNFVDLRNSLRAALKQPASRRVVIYVGPIGQNGSGSSSSTPTSTPGSATASAPTFVPGNACSSAWLLRDAQVGPADLLPIVNECEQYLADLLHLVLLDRRNNAALAQNGTVTEDDRPLVLGSFELLVPFADSDWLSLEKRPPSTSLSSYVTRVSSLEHATASADDSLTDSVAQLTARLAQSVRFESASGGMVASDVVGNIRFARPTLYVFASGDGDAALLGVPGFAMLLDGGYSAQPAYWQLIRHLDRIDAVFLSHASLDNLFGLANILRHKAAVDGPQCSAPTPPVLAHALINAFTFGTGEPRSNPVTPSGSASASTMNGLKVHSVVQADELVRLLAANKIPMSPLLRAAGQPLTPINLFHKIGQGSFDLYVLNPTDCAKELKELQVYCEKLVRDVESHAIRVSQSEADADPPVINRSSKSIPTDRRQPTAKVGAHSFPLSDFASVCALLVYHPASSAEPVTRLLFTGACPQLKVLEGLERMRNVSFLKVPEYHDQPTNPYRALSVSHLPNNGFSLAPGSSNSGNSVSSPTSNAVRKRDASAAGVRATPLRTPSARTLTSADSSRFKTPSIPAISRAQAVSASARRLAPEVKTSNLRVNQMQSQTNVKKPLLAAATNGHATNGNGVANGHEARPKTSLLSATKSTGSSFANRRKEPENAVKSAPKAAPHKIQANGTKAATPSSPTSKRLAKDNSAAITAARNGGDEVIQNHSSHDNDHDHEQNQNQIEHQHQNENENENRTHTEETVTVVATPINGDAAADDRDHHSVENSNGHDATNDKEATDHSQNGTEALNGEREQNGNHDREQESSVNAEEVEYEMSAEEFARALALASGIDQYEENSTVANWGTALGLPSLNDGDGDGDGDGEAANESPVVADLNGVANGNDDPDAQAQLQPVSNSNASAENAEPAAQAPAPAVAAAAAEAGPVVPPRTKPAARTGSATTAKVSNAKTAAPAKTVPKPVSSKATPSASAKATDAKKPVAASSASSARSTSVSARNTKPSSSTTRNATGSPTKERSVAGATRSSTSGTAAAAASPGASGVPFYVDLAYIPAHGNPKYVDMEFFRRVRARYYVLSCLQPSAKVLDALIDAKASSWDPNTPTTLIPTYDSDQLAAWMMTNRDRLAELQIDVAPPANRCTVQLQDHTDQCSAYRLEF